VTRLIYSSFKSDMSLVTSAATKFLACFVELQPMFSLG
jgi:hypothetical protein